MELDNLVTYLRTKHNPKAILLHGSRAWEDAFDNSDFDLAIITDDPDSVRPEFYQGCALDVSGFSLTETVLKFGATPLWPCLVLFDDREELGARMAKRTEEVFLQGPPSLTSEERENRQNFLKRMIDRIQGRGEDPLLRLFYIGGLTQRVLRYWCELNLKWTLSAHRVLPLIAAEDPVFYKALQELQTDTYQNAVKKIHHHLFQGDF